MVSSMCGDALVRSTKKIVPCLQSSMLVIASWSGAAWVLLVLGSCGSLRETWITTCTVTFWSRRWCPLFRNCAERQFSNIIMTPNTPPRWQLPCWWSWRWRWWSGQVCLQTWTPIEHLCGILKRKVEKHHVSNIHQLRDVIMEEWKRMPATACAALVNSMPRMIKEVLDNNGAPTKYWHFGHSFDMFT